MMTYSEVEHTRRVSNDLIARELPYTAEVLNNLAFETLRLQRALWEIAGICGDNVGGESLETYPTDVVLKALTAARKLRETNDEAQHRLESLSK